ncbi:MAG: hypothetical protein IIB22_02595 [Chloroflexi bacterium]|nr:hypothetical protein [Chloroflexota bacterium]
MAIKTWVGRFAIVKGEAQEESSFLRSYPRQRPDEEEDELYVLVEPSAEASDEYTGQLVDAIGRMYRQDALSITGAVLRALKSAHQQLRDWNERSLPEHRISAGVSCLAIREHSAYLAQIGPSVAYHVGSGRFQRIAPEGSALEPLGQADAAEPVFSRYELAPGDLLLIASPKIEELLDESELRSILLRGGDDALVELFKLASGQQDFSLVLLACVVEAEEAVADQEPAAAAPAAEAPTEAGEPAGAEATGAPVPATSDLPQEELPAPPAGLSEPKVRLKGPESDIRYRRPSGLAASIPNIPLPAAIVALVVAVVAFLGVCFLPSALRESSEDQFDASIAAARVALDSAIASDDPAEQRGFLDAADAAIQDAAVEDPDSEEVAALRREFDALKQELDAVLVLPDLDLIVDISERIPGAVSAKDLALGGGGAYFLDREQGRVIAVSLLGPDPDVFVLFEAGDLVGDLVAGQPRHITWADDLNALLILDDERNLIAVTPPAASRLLTVRNADTWSSVDGIAHHDGALYVLDRAGDQVWLYRGSEDGFDSERVPMLDAFDLEEVVEMAVGDVIYLIMADDTIVRFPGGVALPFTQAGIPDPLSSPASLVPAPNLAMLLLADRGNSRTVVFTPDGTYLQQLVSPSFTDLRSIALDEPNELLYILVGGILYRTPLPPPPPEDAASTSSTPTGTDGGTPTDDSAVLTYDVVEREDVSVGEIVRLVFRVQLSSEATEAELEEIANQLITGETQEQDVNALGFFFYLPDSDTSGPYTAGTGDWAPNGNWEDADTVVAGDYTTHELTIEAGSILPP